MKLPTGMQPSTQFMRAHSRVEFNAFMEDFREWCVTFWPEYLERTSCPPPAGAE